MGISMELHTLILKNNPRSPLARSARSLAEVLADPTTDQKELIAALEDCVIAKKAGAPAARVLETVQRLRFDWEGLHSLCVALEWGAEVSSNESTRQDFREGAQVVRPLMNATDTH